MYRHFAFPFLTVFYAASMLLGVQLYAAPETTQAVETVGVVSPKTAEYLKQAQEAHERCQREKAQKQIRRSTSKIENKYINAILKIVIDFGELNDKHMGRIQMMRDILQGLFDLRAKHGFGTQERQDAYVRFLGESKAAYNAYVQATKKLESSDTSTDTDRWNIVKQLTPGTDAQIVSVLERYFSHQYQLKAISMRCSAGVAIGGSAGCLLGTLKDAFGRRYLATGGVVDWFWGAGAGVVFSQISCSHQEAEFAVTESGYRDEEKALIAPVFGFRHQNIRTEWRPSDENGHIVDVCLMGGFRFMGQGRFKAVPVHRLPKIDYKHLREALGI